MPSHETADIHCNKASYCVKQHRAIEPIEYRQVNRR